MLTLSFFLLCMYSLETPEVDSMNCANWSTSVPSNSFPESWMICSRAVMLSTPVRGNRGDVSQSKRSKSAISLAPRGMSSPFFLSGYPLPSQASW